MSLTKIQKQIVEIVSSVPHPWRMGNYTNTSNRCITYWVSGQRIPSNIATIEDVLDAYGYELKIVRKDEPQAEIKGSKRLLKGSDEPQTDCPYREYPCDVCDEQADCPWK